jgi:hypothetical protein
MANQFLQYPYLLEKAVNGGYVCVDPKDSTNFYSFSTQADLIYWIGFNEQTPAAPAPATNGTVSVI